MSALEYNGAKGVDADVASAELAHLLHHGGSVLELDRVLITYRKLSPLSEGVPQLKRR